MTTIITKVTNPPLELYVSKDAFQPNPTTVRFARAVQITPGDIVFDIGTGVGPLAIMAAMGGASRVVGVDPVEVHCELARKNVEKYGLADRVRIFRGRFFDPFEREPELAGLKANVIIGDVSGIADKVSRALGWYSDDVPTGGHDGTDVIIDFLSRAPKYLVPGGSIYFPIANDLSDGEKIVQAASKLYQSVENCFGKDYIEFPLRPEEVDAILAAYEGNLPPFIQIQQGRRASWRGQIMRARMPM